METFCDGILKFIFTIYLTFKIMFVKNGHDFYCVPGMAFIQSELNRPRVVTAKCSEPQVITSNGNDEGSGVAILSSVRTET